MKSKFVSGAIIVVALIVTLTLVAVATPQAIEPIDFDGATNPPIDIVVPSEPTDGIGNTIVTVPSNPSAENIPPEPNNNNGFGIVIPPAMNENVPDVIVPSNPPAEKVPAKPAADTEASTKHENDDEVGSINMYPVKNESLKDVLLPESDANDFVATPDEAIPSEPEADVSAPPKDEEDDIVTSPIPTEPENDEEDKNLPVATPDEPTNGNSDTIDSVKPENGDDENATAPYEPTNTLVQFADSQICHIIAASDITLDDGVSCVLFLYADSRYHNFVIEKGEWYFQGEPSSEPCSEPDNLTEIKPVDIATWMLDEGSYYVLYSNGDWATLTVHDGVFF